MSKIMERPQGSPGSPAVVDLSIVIVNHQTCADLSVCLDSLSYLLEDDLATTEIIIVDNSPGDERMEAILADFPDLRYLPSPGNYGYAYACNRGLRIARGKQILFLNPDVRDRGREVLRFLEQKLEEPDVGILTVGQVDRRGRPQRPYGSFPTAASLFGPVRAVRRYLLGGSARPQTEAELMDVDWVSGAALMVSREALEMIGPWSEDYWMYSEDVDLCRRARAAGLRVAYAGDIVLEHGHGAASRRTPSISALTRAEVVISKHVYASRHLRGLHRVAFHLVCILTRFIPLAVPAAIATVWKRAPAAVTVRARMFRHLLSYYRLVFSDHDWRSPRTSGRASGRPGGEPAATHPASTA